MAKLLIVTCPATQKSIAVQWDDNTTTEVECFIIDAPRDDLRTTPALPGEQYRVPLTALVMANVVNAMTDVLKKLQEG